MILTVIVKVVELEARLAEARRKSLYLEQVERSMQGRVESGGLTSGVSGGILSILTLILIAACCVLLVAMRLLQKRDVKVSRSD